MSKLTKSQQIALDLLRYYGSGVVSNKATTVDDKVVQIHWRTANALKDKNVIVVQDDEVHLHEHKD